ncbi:FHA domain-containing protein [Oerskovia turbata]|uniref:FHA domain-containing protein n=1 Tax=Oerskovia turbata TaxID=1713 RepID=A0A4Q1KT34_9CELL|nr:RDD family protein [Oerskovia turbata]RXR23565.1 FHA domain-containing protein [Oerskovia turbata]RXR32835.1 FHA domain-containing protein [Oerskovia turbata]
MSEQLSCSACGTAQPAGSSFCAVCGTKMPSTAVPYGAPVGGAPSSGREPSIAITTERDVAAATQRAVPFLRRTDAAAPQTGLDGAPVAGTGRRFVAFLVDAAAVSLVFAAVLLGGGAVAGVSPTALASVTTPAEAQVLLGRLLFACAVAGAVSLACWGGIWFWEGRTGRTLGNLATGVRSVRAEDRSPLGFGRAALRWIITFLGALALGIGELLVVLSPAFDSSGRNQGWQDKAAKALVLDVRGLHDGNAEVGAVGQPSTHQVATPPSGYRGPSPSGPLPAGSFAAQTGGQAPGAGAAPVGDPWAFPQQSQQAPVAPVGGLITGVPGAASPSGSAPVTPSPALGPLAVPATTATPAPAHEEPDWDSTRLSAREIRHEAHEATPTPGAVLELESGQRVPLTGPALVGRNPQASGGEARTLVRVEDPTRSVSKTHVELGFDAGGLWVQDRGSTNGTVLLRPGGAPVALDPGVRVPVPVGSVITVGDRRIVVHPGSGA